MWCFLVHVLVYYYYIMLLCIKFIWFNSTIMNIWGTFTHTGWMCRPLKSLKVLLNIMLRGTHILFVFLDWSSVNDNGSDIKVGRIIVMHWSCSFLLFALLGLGWWQKSFLHENILCKIQGDRNFWLIIIIINYNYEVITCTSVHVLGLYASLKL